jgi:alginate O-acetyltransferase complex protein AlgI
MKFNFYTTIPFWISFCVIVISVRFLDRVPSLRRYLLLVFSVFMILSIPGFTAVNLAYLFILSGFSYSIGYFLSTNNSLSAAARKTASILGIVGVMGFLAFYKYQFLQNLILGNAPPDESPASRVVFMIGVSYFSFKMVHFIVESYRRKIERLSILSYISYILFFAPFVSGPINRFNHFALQEDKKEPGGIKSDLMSGGERIVHGLFKKFVLVQIIHPYILGNQTEALTNLSFGGVLLGLYAYAFYFYFDFSGYSDLAIGSARLLGIELPENFNNPFLKRNIRELWTNWHMSLTGWLVDYIYWPLVRKMRDAKYLRARPVLLSNLGMIVTFIACGMWHGETANFLLWGAYHGMGISILTIYQRQKRKVRNPTIQRYFRSKLSVVIGTFVTFNFFALGLALFVLDMRNLGILFNSLWLR